MKLNDMDFIGRKAHHQSQKRDCPQLVRKAGKLYKNMYLSFESLIDMNEQKASNTGRFAGILVGGVFSLKFNAFIIIYKLPRAIRKGGEDVLY